MKNQGKFVLGIRDKFAIEVKEAELLDQVEKTILNYFDEIGASLKKEFEMAPSLFLELKPGYVVFLTMTINGHGIEFEREEHSIQVNEVLDDSNSRFYDHIYVEDSNVITKYYHKTAFTSEVLDKYLGHLFAEYLAE